MCPSLAVSADVEVLAWGEDVRAALLPSLSLSLSFPFTVAIAVAAEVAATIVVAMVI